MSFPSAIKQRSIFLLKDPDGSESFFKELTQDDRDVRIPASAEHVCSRQEKITIPFDACDPKLADTFDKVLMLDLKYNKATNDPKNNRTTLFSDFYNMDSYGLSIEVAPQKAENFDEYKELSTTAIEQILKVLRINDDSEPTFFQEWYKKEVFDIEGDDEANSVQLMTLRLWNALLRRNVELPIRLPDIACADQLELLLHGKTREVSLSLYWNNVRRPTILSKKYAVQTGAPVETEVGLFYEMDLDPDQYNPPLSGLRMRIDKQELQKSGGNPKFFPTMVYASPLHSTLYGYEATHKLGVPTGMHPDYQVTISATDDKFGFEPNSAAPCDLYFQLDVPKSVIIDQYQLERYKGRSYADFYVHNGGMDLELPEYRAAEWGGSVTVKLNQTHLMDQGNYTFEVPLHFRYGKPLGEFENVTIPKGQLYWQCPMSKLEQNLTAQSFYNEHDRLGLDKFASNVMFYHVPDASGRCNYMSAKIPTADLADESIVEKWTLLVVILGAAYILAGLFRRA